MFERIIKVEKEEAGNVYLLLLYAVVMGLAYAFLYTASTALFLAEFDIRFLPYTYVAGGLLSYLLWVLYNQFSKRILFSKLLLWGAVFLLLSTALLTWAYNLSGNRYFTFALVLWLNVFMFLNGVGFYGITGKIYNLQQGKRLFGLISSGEVFSKVISFFSIPFILTLLQTQQLLYFAVAGTGFCLLLIFFIVRRLHSRLDIMPAKAAAIPAKATGLKAAIRDKYSFYILLLAIFPLFSAYFVDYGFLNLTKETFKTTENVGQFLGVFLGFMTVTEFVVKSFLSVRFISRYGVLFTLLVLPVLLLLSTMLAALFAFSDTEMALFFSLIALNKLMIRVLRTSSIDPVFQILYQAVPLDKRGMLQAKVEGISKSFGNILAGVLLILLSHAAFITVVYHNFFLLVVLGVWVWLSFKVYQEYRTSLKAMMASNHSTDAASARASNTIRQFGLDDKPEPESFSKQISLLYGVEPALANFMLLRLLPKSEPAIQRQILQLIELKQLLPARQIIDFCLRRDVQEGQLEDMMHTRAALENAGKRSIQELTAAAESEHQEDRIVVAELIAHYENYNAYKILKSLINDKDKFVRNAALIASGKRKHRELWPYIIRNVANPDSYYAAATAVKSIGEPILVNLLDFYSRESAETRTHRMLVRLCAEIGGDKATRFLRNKSNIPDEVRERVLSGLLHLGYRVSKYNMPAARQAIEADVRMVVWLTATMLDVEQQVGSEELMLALEQERWQKQVIIFLQLSLMYDSSATSFFIRHFRQATEEARAYALEVLDLTVPQDMKPLILPLVSGLSREELVKRYADRFPQQQLPFHDRLEDIINKDFLRVGKYTKCCAIQLAAKLAGTEKCIAANFMHPDKMIRETSMWGLYHRNQKMLQDKVQCLKKNEQEQVVQLLQKFTSPGYHLGISVVQKLQQMFLFASLSHAELVRLAEESVQVLLPESSEYSISYSQQKDCFVVLEGKVIVLQDRQLVQALEPGSFFWQLDDLAEISSDVCFYPQQDAVLLQVNFNLMHELLSVHKQMVKAILEPEKEPIPA